LATPDIPIFIYTTLTSRSRAHKYKTLWPLFIHNICKHTIKEKRLFSTNELL